MCTQTTCLALSCRGLPSSEGSSRGAWGVDLTSLWKALGLMLNGGGGAAAREVPCLPQEGVRDDGQLCPLSSHLACPSLPARKELIF